MSSVGEFVDAFASPVAAARLDRIARLAVRALGASWGQVLLGVASPPDGFAELAARARATVGGAVNAEQGGEHLLALTLRRDGAVVAIFLARSPAPFVAEDVATVRELADLVLDELAAPQTRAAYAHASAILASSHDAIIGKTLDGVVTTWNRGAEEMFGLPAAAMIGRPVTAIIPPARLAEESELLARVGRGEVVDGFDTVRRRADGQVLEVSIVLSPIRAGDQVVGVASVVRDVTARRAAERAQAAMLAERNAIFEHAAYGIVTTDDAGTIVTMNRALEEMTGHRAADLIGRATPATLHVAEEVAAHAAAVSAAFGVEIPPGHESFVARTRRGLPNEGEWTYVRKDGSRFRGHLTITALRDADQQITGFIGLIADITERNRAVEELRESEQRFRLSFEHAGIGQAILTADGRWVEANASLCTMLGFTEAELQQTTFQALTHPDDVYIGRDLAPALLVGEIPVLRAEKRYQRKDGRYLWCRLTTVVTRTAEGAAFQYVSQIEDITARKEAAEERLTFERKLAETAKLESLGVLAGGIAHDFNNLLTGMLGNASLMRLELPAHSPHLASISDIEAAARRAADLCRQMLAYSGRGRFIIERVDVNTLIEDMARLLELSISKQAVLRYHLTAAPLYVEADVTQLRQIIMNLVINASEAVGARSGVIALATGVARLDAEYLRTLQSFEDLPPGDYVTIEVSDDGSGMDGDTLRRIFEPFFTTKFTGRGLGLAAVQGIVRGHKGGLKVYSEVGKGTTFRLLLPASERSEAVVPRVESTPAPGPISRGTVLVVDDEETVRSVAARLLERMGLEVVLAGDGREGVDKFRADPARYALVLLDLTMPHLDGEETFRQLRHIRPGIRVILSSGFNHQEVLTRFAGKGLAGFVQKPFEARTLMNEVSRVIADS